MEDAAKTTDAATEINEFFDEVSGALEKQKTELLAKAEQFKQEGAGNVIFTANNTLLETMNKPFVLGTLENTDALTEYHVELIRNLDVKGRDRKTCKPSGSVLLPGNALVIADFANFKLKLLDTATNKVTSELQFSPAAFGVCRVTDTQVAVTILWNKEIVLVNTTPELKIDRKIPVSSECYGIAHYDGKFVVSYTSNKVEILDMEGTVLKTIENDESGEPLFKGAYSLAVNPFSGLIYVSNHGSSNVVCLDFDGNMVSKYEDDELKGPYQMIFKNRLTGFVLGRDSKNLHQITADCKKVAVLTGGLYEPECLSFSEREGELYIGQGNNAVKVFKVSPKML